MKKNRYIDLEKYYNEKIVELGLLLKVEEGKQKSKKIDILKEKIEDCKNKLELLPKSDVVLSLDNISMHFGGLKAVNGLDLTLYDEETLGIIGPNGAGKTTLFNVICGVLKPTAGRVILDGEEIQGLAAHKIAHRGVARTFQISKPLKDISILDNVVASLGIHEYTGIRSLFKNSHKKETIEKALEILERTGLIEFKDKLAREVSLGYLRRLEIARALATNPRLIMLDEPCAGLSNFAINEIIDLVMQLKEEGKSIILIEHNLPISMKVSDRIVVLNYGQKIAEGEPEEIQNNPEVIEAYLGEDDDIA